MFWVPVAQLVYKASITTASSEAAGPLKVLTDSFWFTMHGLSNFTIHWKRVPNPLCPAQKIAHNHGLISVPRAKFCFSSYSLKWKEKISLVFHGSLKGKI